MDTKLTSIINFKQVGPIILFAVLGFGAVGIIFFLRGLEDFHLGKPLFKTLLPVSIFLFLFSVCSLYHLIVTFPKVIISNDGITFKTLFKRSFYNWYQIQSIKLTGKEPMRFLYVQMPMEAASLSFSDNTKKVIWADNYRNANELRAALNKVNTQLNLNQVISIGHPDFNKNPEAEANETFLSYKEYSGDWLLSFNGIVLFGWIFFILIILFSRPGVFLLNMGALLSVLFATMVVCGMMIYQLHYFVITDTQLIINNHVWIWKNKAYHLDNITEVVVETPHKRSTSLRIIDKDFNSTLYPAGSLRNNTWKNLIKELADRQITVRNEALD